MGKLTDLAERCEKATRPDRELDAQIVEALGYHRTVEGSFYTGPILRYYGKGPIGEVGRLKKLTIPKFTVSLDAAMTLLPGATWWAIDGVPSVEFIACVDNDVDKTTFGQSYNPAHALCAAALRARSKSTPDILRSDD